MELCVRATPLTRHRDAAVILLVQAGVSVRRSASACGRPFGEACDLLVERRAFRAKPAEVRVLTGGPEDRIPTLVLAGLGKEGGAAVLRRAAAAAARAARDAGARSVSIVLPHGSKRWQRADHAAEAAVDGALVGLYRFENHKREKAKTAVDALTVLVPRGEVGRGQKGAERGLVLGEAVCFARDLGNEPGNEATPTFLAERARRLATDLDLGVKILDEEDMKRLGMGALLAVSRGSAEPPRLIVLTYEPERRGSIDTVAIVGKGLTFDSGGISIKPSAKMEDMKFDMCGGAAVLATMQAVARLEVPVRVVGLVPASENLSGAAAYKPGDILTAMNGTTIEVKNTDAEGRLILADALAYVSTKLKPRPKAVVDVATLTGACVVALGDQFAGLVSNDSGLAARIEEAGKASGDLVWRLPLVDGYRKKLESAYADASNLGGPGAGAITAAAFLEKFVGRLRWAHIDIAGMAWTDKQSPPFTKGATGFGVRVMTRLLSEWRRG